MIFMSCAREAPPTRPSPLPSPTPTPEAKSPEPKPAEPEETKPGPEQKPTPKPTPKPKQESKPAPKAEKKPEPPKEEPKAAEPTLVGTWRVTEMSHNGQSAPMPGEMMLTFTSDGQVRVGMVGPDGQAQEREEGTYTVNGDQLVVTEGGHDQTMTFKFIDASHLELSFDGQVMKLERV
jgi:hypothetical protein